jgi:hypothetical protein
MSALQCADLQDMPIGRLAPQSSKPAGRNILLPFPGIFIVHFKETLNNEEFKHTLCDFFKEKNYNFPQPTHNKALISRTPSAGCLP